MDTTKKPPPNHTQLDAHFLPRPAAEQMLGYMAAFKDVNAIALAAAGGAKVVRAQVPWEATEDPLTGALSLPEHAAAGLLACKAAGVQPCLIAAYGSPYTKLAEVVVSKDTPAGSYTVPITTSITSTAPLGTLWLIGHTGGQVSELNGYAGSLLLSGGNVLALASKTAKDIPAGTKLRVNRMRFAPPSSRNPADPWRQAFRHYAMFLAEQIAQAGLTGWVCLQNEPNWPDNPLGLEDYYDVRPKGMSSGHMHTILATFFNTVAPPGVRFISGAPDTVGGHASILKQYAEGEEGNLGTNYIPMPSGPSLAAWCEAEGVHPYGSNPEGSGLGPNHEVLNPRVDDQSAFTGVIGHVQQWGPPHGYSLKVFATECGGRWNPVKGQPPRFDQQARYDLRRVLSLWMMGVPMVVIYNLSVGGAGFTVVGEGPNGEAVPHEAYDALQRLTALLEACGPVGPPPTTAPAFVSATGNTWPLWTGAFQGTASAVLFAWQRTWGEGKSEEPTSWWQQPSPEPATLKFSCDGAPTVQNVRTGESIAATKAEGATWTVPVADDPIAIIG